MPTVPPLPRLARRVAVEPSPITLPNTRNGVQRARASVIRAFESQAFTKLFSITMLSLPKRGGE